MLIKSNNEYYQRFQFSGISRDPSLHRGLVTGGLVIGRQWVVILLSWRRGVGVWLSRGRVGKLLPRGCVESRGCVWHARIVLSRVRLCRVHTGYCVCCKFKHFIGEKIKIFYISIFLTMYLSHDGTVLFVSIYTEASTLFGEDHCLWFSSIFLTHKYIQIIVL